MANPLGTPMGRTHGLTVWIRAMRHTSRNAAQPKNEALRESHEFHSVGGELETADPGLQGWVVFTARAGHRGIGIAERCFLLSEGCN